MAATASSAQKNKPWRPDGYPELDDAANFLLGCSSHPCVEEAEMFTLFPESDHSDFILTSFFSLNKYYNDTATFNDILSTIVQKE
jgi:hypothetical protein